MTARSDVTVDFILSPRLAELTSASSEIVVQDSHDTLTGIQDSIEGSEFSNLVSTAGKEELGGGVSVGLTQTLDNVQYAPQATVPRSMGSITTTDVTGISLTDTGATFVTDGVTRGDWVINFSDQSVSEVISVLSETSLTTRGLRSGTLNQFTSGNLYKVWEVSEFSLAGGNFVAVDENDVSINPAFTTFGRFITRTSSASATLQDLNSLQAASFTGGVAIDASSSNTGTMFPNGTRSFPVNNTADALAIANERGLKTFFVVSPLTLTSLDFSDGFTFLGDNAVISTLHINPGANVSNCQFSNLTISGEIDNFNVLRECSVNAITNVNGFIFNCSLNATVTLAGGIQCTILDCYSGVAGGGGGQTAAIDMGGSGQSLALRGFKGGLALRNFSGTDGVSLDFSSGRAVIDATVTAGEITIRGVVDIEDMSTGTASINDRTYVTEIWKEDLSSYAIDATAGEILHSLKGLSIADITLIKDILEADEEYTETSAIKKHKDTKAILVSKAVAGGTLTTPIVIDE